jgi:hypothetical protein
MGISGSNTDSFQQTNGSGENYGYGSQSGQQSGTWKPNAAVAPIYGQIAGMLGNMLQTPGYFPGQTYIGPSQATQQGVNMGMSSMPWYNQAAEGLGQAGQTYGQAATTLGGAVPYQAGAANTALGNYNFLSNAADVANNPYVQGQLGVNAQRVGQQFNENWLPSINSGAQAVNALGSTRQGVAQAQGLERATQQLANANAETMLGAYGQGLGAQQNALGQVGNLQQAFMQPGRTAAEMAKYQEQGGNLQGLAGDWINKGAQQALGYGQNVEGYQQKALDDAMNRYNYQYQSPYQQIEQLGSVLNNLFQPTGTTLGAGTGTTTQQGNNAYTGKGWGQKSTVSGGMGF